MMRSIDAIKEAAQKGDTSKPDQCRGSPGGEAEYRGIAEYGDDAGRACAGFLQLHSREGMRGRVMALYSIAFLGVAPIGGPAVGGVAQLLQARAGFLVGALAAGLAGIVAATWLLSRRRPVCRHPPVS